MGLGGGRRARDDSYKGCVNNVNLRVTVFCACTLPVLRSDAIQRRKEEPMTKSTNSRRGRAFQRTSLIALTLGALIAFAVWADSKNSELRLRTWLAGGAISGEVPTGHADFRSESDRNRSRLNVEVEDVNLASGTVLDVMVSHGGASAKVGVIHLRAEG